MKYVVLLKFTEKGVTNVRNSPDRATAFQATAEKSGASVVSQYWTLGSYDGVIVLDAPDEATAAGLVLGLGGADNVSTCMLRALDASEFKAVIEKMG